MKDWMKISLASLITLLVVSMGVAATWGRTQQRVDQHDHELITLRGEVKDVKTSYSQLTVMLSDVKGDIKVLLERTEPQEGK